MVQASSLPEYGNFDDPDVYEKCLGAASRRDTKNFVIEFDSSKAYAAHDLDDASMKRVLQLEVFGCFLHPRRQRRYRLIAMTLEAFRLTSTGISEQSIRMQDGCMYAPPLPCLQHMMMRHVATFGPLNDRRAWFWCVTTTPALTIPMIEYLGSGRVLQLFSSTPWHHVLRPFYQRPTSARDPSRWRCLARQEISRRAQISRVAIARS